jgi:regulator of RNase E activity RraA
MSDTKTPGKTDGSGDSLSRNLEQLFSMPRPLSDFSTANFNDAMERIGIHNRVLDQEIRPLLPYTKMVGVAVTLKLDLCESDGVYVEEYAKAMEAGPLVPSPILVVEIPRDFPIGTVGSGAAYVMRRHYGFVGCLIEGNLRDTDDLRNMHFQCYHRGFSPGFQFGKMKGISAQEPVTVGGVRISPGDVIVGDNDGVVAIPFGDFDRIMAAVREDLVGEMAILHEIDAGGPYLEAIRRHQPWAFGKKGGI